MERLRPQPRRRRTVSARTQRLISYAWIVASLALPAMGVVAMAGSTAVLPDTEAISHTVRAGENLGAIAQRYGITVDQIVQANGLNNPNLIYAGQVLTIPRLEQAVRGESQLYTIRNGDTLGRIAQRYGVTVDQLVAANNLPNPNSIVAGKTLSIPGTTTTAAPSADTPAEQPSQTVEMLTESVSSTSTNYTLRRGDSLYRIGLVYGISVDDLLAVNNLANPNAIYPGLTLRIPNPETRLVVEVPLDARGAAGESTGPTGGRTYVISPGDTLSKIAIAHSVTVDGLVAANGLNGPDRIYAGQRLNIPESGAGARAAPAHTGTVHTVKTGETLADIALRYGVTIHSLAVANSIGSTYSLVEGMQLSIPGTQAGSNSVSYANVGAGLCADVDLSRSGTGYFIRPVRGYIITQKYHVLHAGIDLALSLGAPVYAADGGTVVFSGWNPVGYGNLIVLDHGNGWRSYYAHLQTVNVTCGDWVPRGSIMGEIGSSGNSTGPHLHYEMLRFGIAVDPAGYIRF